MEKILEALLAGIRALGVEAVISPQKTSANAPRFELFLAGIENAGIDRQNPKAGSLGWERVVFNAVFKSEGTHIVWVNGIIKALRKINPLNEKPLTIIVEADKLYRLPAVWKRIAAGRFEYPDEEESSMPVRYTEQWEVSVAYPANLIEEET